MKTGKFILLRMVLVPMTVLAAVSCAKSGRVYENAGKEEISMTALSSPMVRAISDYPVGNIFGVYAYASSLDGGTPWKQAIAASDLYLENVKFICAEEGGSTIARGAEESYYWPFAGSLLVYGYSPHIEQSDGCIKSVNHFSNVQSPTDANAYFAIDFEQKSAPEEMEELLWFDFKDVGGGVSLTKGTQPVVVFRRAHSKVTFNLSYSYYSKVTVRLTECIYRGIFYSGAAPGWMPDSSKDLNGNFTYLTQYMMFDQGRTEESFNGSVSMFMIPQYTDGNFKEVGVQLGGDMTLEIEITDGDIGGASTVVSKRLKDYTELWEMGRHYTYNINVKPRSIQFGEPEVVITTESVTI